MDVITTIFQGIVGRIPFDASAVDLLSDSGGPPQRDEADEHTRQHASSRHRPQAPRQPERSASMTLLAFTKTRASHSKRRFVDILVESVERDLVHRELELKARELEENIDFIQKQYDFHVVYLNAVARHGVRETQSVLMETQAEIERLRTILESEWRDGNGRTFTCGLKDIRADAVRELKRTSSARAGSLRLLCRRAQDEIEEALETGRTAGLPLNASFCAALRVLADSAKVLEESERRFRGLRRAVEQRKSVDTARTALATARAGTDPAQVEAGAAQLSTAKERLAEANRVYENEKSTIEAQRRNQRRREESFLDEEAHPLLVAEDYLHSQKSPTLPPTPASLTRMSDSEDSATSEDTSIGSSKGEHEEEDAEPFATEWKQARTALAHFKQQYNAVVENHATIIADHLATYRNATLRTAEGHYKEEVGDMYINLERQTLNYVEHAQEYYDQVRAQAAEAGIEDLPLSPIHLADWSQDGRTGSAGSAWLEAVQASAPDVERRVLRWSRTVARGGSQRTPQISPTWSLSTVGSLKPADHDVGETPSDRGLLARYARKTLDVRPVAERLRRDAWIGRLRDTRARRLQTNSQWPSWHRTHPAQTVRDISREGQAQRIAIQAGRRRTVSVRRELSRSEVYVTRKKVIKW